MTTEEAIQELRGYKQYCRTMGFRFNGWREALDMAIEALSKMDAKENYWMGCESCDRAMEDGKCELWDDRMIEECGAWKERKNEKTQ